MVVNEKSTPVDEVPALQPFLRPVGRRPRLGNVLFQRNNNCSRALVSGVEKYVYFVWPCTTRFHGCTDKQYVLVERWVGLVVVLVLYRSVYTVSFGLGW